jgi:hypothetical protein
MCSVDGKALCLICSESTAVLKEYNISTLKDKDKEQRQVQNRVGALRREKVATLKRWLQSQQIIFRKHSN